MIIKAATGAAADEIAQIQASAFDVPWSTGDLKILLEAAPSVSLLASVEGAGVGFVLGRVVADEAEVLSLAVRPEHRRRRIGHELIAAWSEAIMAAGARTAFLEVAADNVAAIALYRSAGYKVTGRRKNYYHRRDGSFGDALMMMVNLPAKRPS